MTYDHHRSAGKGYSAVNCMKQLFLETLRKTTGHYLKLYGQLRSPSLLYPFASRAFWLNGGEQSTLSPRDRQAGTQRRMQAGSVACPPRILLAREYGDIFVGAFCDNFKPI